MDLEGLEAMDIERLGVPEDLTSLVDAADIDRLLHVPVDALFPLLRDRNWAYSKHADPRVRRFLVGFCARAVRFAPSQMAHHVYPLLVQLLGNADQSVVKEVIVEHSNLLPFLLSHMCRVQWTPELDLVWTSISGMRDRIIRMRVCPASDSVQSAALKFMHSLVMHQTAVRDPSIPRPPPLFAPQDVPQGHTRIKVDTFQKVAVGLVSFLVQQALTPYAPAQGLTPLSESNLCVLIHILHSLAVERTAFREQCVQALMNLAFAHLAPAPARRVRETQVFFLSSMLRFPEWRAQITDVLMSAQDETKTSGARQRFVAEAVKRYSSAWYAVGTAPAASMAGSRLTGVGTGASGMMTGASSSSSSSSSSSTTASIPQIVPHHHVVHQMSSLLQALAGDREALAGAATVGVTRYFHGSITPGPFHPVFRRFISLLSGSQGALPVLGAQEGEQLQQQQQQQQQRQQQVLQQQQQQQQQQADVHSDPRRERQRLVAEKKAAQSSTLFKKIPQIVAPQLSTEECQEMCTMTLERILSPHTQLALEQSGHSLLYATLLAKLATGATQAIVQPLMLQYVLGDLQSRLEVVLRWMYALAVRKTDRVAYDEVLNDILQGMQDRLAPSDRLFARFVAQLPLVSDVVMQRIQEYALEPSRNRVALEALHSLIVKRPRCRKEALTVLLGLAHHEASIIRKPSIQDVAKRLFALPFVAEPIRQFALDRLLELKTPWVDDRPEPATEAEEEELLVAWKARQAIQQQEALGGMIMSITQQEEPQLPMIEEENQKEKATEEEDKKEEKTELTAEQVVAREREAARKAAQDAEQHKIELKRARDEREYERTKKQTDLYERKVGLFYALCQQDASLLVEALRVWVDCPNTFFKERMMMNVPSLFQLTQTQEAALQVLTACPAGGEQLAKRCVYIAAKELREKGEQPSEALCAAAQKLAEDSADVGCLVPILHGLPLAVIQRHFTDIFCLGPVEVDAALTALVHADPPPMRHVDILLRLHDIPDVRKAIAAIDKCLAMRQVFEPHLGLFLQRLIEQRTVPELTMRTIIMVQQSFPRLSVTTGNCVVNMVRADKLSSRPNLWKGFILFCNKSNFASELVLALATTKLVDDAVSQCPNVTWDSLFDQAARNYSSANIQDSVWRYIEQKVGKKLPERRRSSHKRKGGAYSSTGAGGERRRFKR